VAEQLVFDLADAEPPSFANFVAGPNREAVAALEAAARGEAREPGILLWGARDAGKSHLLRAAVHLARACGRAALALASPSDLGDAEPVAGMLIAVDDVERAEESAQGRLFSLYNALAASGGTLVTAAPEPPARLPLRADLRTRLGWGLAFEILPLPDADKATALAAYARDRGFALPADVIAYLLAHGRRDMRTLVGALAALDRRSLATKRPITVALLREWLQREIRAN
jgi:DnaA-homolog protein